MLKNFNTWFLKFWLRDQTSKITTVFDYRMQLFLAYFITSIILFFMLPCLVYGIKLGYMDGYYNLSIAAVKETKPELLSVIYGIHWAIIAMLALLTFALGFPIILCEYILEPLFKKYQNVSPKLSKMKETVIEMYVQAAKKTLGAVIWVYQPTFELLGKTKVKVLEKTKSKELDEETIKKLN